MPAAKRRRYVVTAASRLAPFEHPSLHVEVAGTTAMVWMWDRDAVDAAVDPEGGRPGPAFPESVYVGGPPAQSAIELQAMSEGVEGRVWTEGVLVASSWWPATPSHREWASFLRGSGQPVTPVPAVLGHSLRDASWGVGGRVAWQDLQQRMRVPAIAVASGLVALALAAPVGSMIRLKAQEAAIDRAAASLDRGLQEVMLARETAERDLVEIDRLRALRPPSGILDLMASVAEATPGNGWQVLELRLLDPETLELVLRLERPDPEQLVTAWEASGAFADVNAEIGRDRNEVRMRARVLRGGAR